MAKMPFPCCCGDCLDILDAWRFVLTGWQPWADSYANAKRTSEQPIGLGNTSSDVWYFWGGDFLHDLFENLTQTWTFSPGDASADTVLVGGVPYGATRYAKILTGFLTPKELILYVGHGSTKPAELSFIPYTLDFGTNWKALVIIWQIPSLNNDRRGVIHIFGDLSSADATIVQPTGDKGTFGFTELDADNFYSTVYLSGLNLDVSTCPQSIDLYQAGDEAVRGTFVNITPNSPWHWTSPGDPDEYETLQFRFDHRGGESIVSGPYDYERGTFGHP